MRVGVNDAIVAVLLLLVVVVDVTGSVRSDSEMTNTTHLQYQKLGRLLDRRSGGGVKRGGRWRVLGSSKSSSSCDYDNRRSVGPDEVETYFYVEYATNNPTLENFESASSTDLIEAYNDLIQFCNNPYDITLEDIVILQASAADDARQLGRSDDDEPTNMDLAKQRAGHKIRKRILQRSRAFGFLQGFGSCGRACPSNSRLFDDTSSRRLEEPQLNHDHHVTRSLGVHSHSRSSSSPDFDPCVGDYPTQEEMMMFYSAFVASRNYNNIVDVVTIEELDEPPVFWSKCSKTGSQKSGKKRGTSAGSKSSKRRGATRGSHTKRRSDDDDGRHHSKKY